MWPGSDCDERWFELRTMRWLALCATGTGVMGLDRRESAAIADCGLALGVGRLEMVGARLDAVAEVEPV